MVNSFADLVLAALSFSATPDNNTETDAHIEVDANVTVESKENLSLATKMQACIPTPLFLSTVGEIFSSNSRSHKITIP